MGLAAILLLLIMGVHYTYDPLALLYADPAKAARALFYALRGIEGAALFAIVAMLARHPAVRAVCLWGMVEEGQTTVCRLAMGIDQKPNVELFQGLCGNGWYTLGLMAALLITVCLIHGIQGEKTNG